MAVLNAGFERGTSGATIATGDVGDLDAWDAVTIGTAAAAIYDTAHAMFGLKAAKVSTGATSTNALLSWIAKLGTQTSHYGRVYLYLTANPASSVNVIVAPSGAVNNPSVQINTAGKLRLLDAAGAQQGISTNTISLNQWIRIEYHFVHSATVGQIEAKLFNTATSSTPTETLTSVATLNTNVSADRVRFGIVNNNANAGPFWLDQIQAGAGAYPGPYVAPAGRGFAIGAL